MTGTSSRATAAPLPLTPRRVLAIFSGLMLGMFLAALDQTIVSTALPRIVSDLGGLAHLSWIVTAYLLASTAATPLWGKLGDIYGRKLIFQASILVFLVGSALCGFSGTMGQLILFRAIQGIGGGGLIVTAQGAIGDIVSPRDRGRYQGIFAGVFAASSIFGPLAGGFFVDFLSWHWVFFVNVPIGIVAFAVTAATFPASVPRRERSIDYLGALLVAGAATSFIVFTTVGGTVYPWVSIPSIGLALLALTLTAILVRVERRAKAPVFPLHLFSNPVFRNAAFLAFCVGIAMLGTSTFVPAFLQAVNGATATESGLRMLPLMLGVPVTSVLAGQLISRSGRYRRFPIIGTTSLVAALLLLSTMDRQTPVALTSVYLFMLGTGLGFVMQVTILSTQNAVDYADLGAATSGVAFFRAIGFAFGVALLGAIFSGRLDAELGGLFAGETPPMGFDPHSVGIDPIWMATLPGDLRERLSLAFAASLRPVFLVAVPFALLALFFAVRLKELPLRETARGASTSGSLASSVQVESAAEIERTLSDMMKREPRRQAYEWLAHRAGVDLPPMLCWLLYRIDELRPATVTALTAHLPVSRANLEAHLQSLERRGLVTLVPDTTAPSDTVVDLSEQGRVVFERLVAARQERLEAKLAGWAPERHAELDALVRRLARVMVPEPE